MFIQVVNGNGEEEEEPVRRQASPYNKKKKPATMTASDRPVVKRSEEPALVCEGGEAGTLDGETVLLPPVLPPVLPVPVVEGMTAELSVVGETLVELPAG